MNETFITPTQLAKYWGIHRTTVHYYIRRNRIPAIKIELDESVRYLIPASVLNQPII